MTRKRTGPKPSIDDVVKVCAKDLNISKKRLKRMVQEAKLRTVAERIVREELDASWSDIVDRARPSDGAKKQ